jgi:hypothetical protein
MGKICEMYGVRDHGENDTPELYLDEQSGRLVVRAFNEGRHNVTHVDLLDLLAWVKTNRPELLTDAGHDIRPPRG